MKINALRVLEKMQLNTVERLLFIKRKKTDKI